jgi:hypothetical protein
MIASLSSGSCMTVRRAVSKCSIPRGKLICSQFLMPVCANLDVFFSSLLPNLQVDGCRNCSSMLGGALFGHGC